MSKAGGTMLNSPDEAVASFCVECTGVGNSSLTLDPGFGWPATLAMAEDVCLVSAFLERPLPPGLVSDTEC